MKHSMLRVEKVQPKTIERFIRKIKVNEQNKCWEWQGNRNNGYGEIRVEKRLHRVHRFVYAWLVAPIPAGKGRDIPVLDHICRNRGCCNPKHLRLIPDRDNILLGDGATAVKARQITCQNGHSLPPPVRGHRRCMICRREWNRRNYARNPEKFKTLVRERNTRLKNERQHGGSGFIVPSGDGLKSLN